jgi:hypothetical protein
VGGRKIAQKGLYNEFNGKKNWLCVTTLALGLRPMQGLVKVWAKREAQESHLMLLRVQKSLRE